MIRNRSKRILNNLRIELSHQNNNFADYEAIMSELGLIPESERPTHLGNRQIYKTYRYFKEKIATFRYKDLIDFLEK